MAQLYRWWTAADAVLKQHGRPALSFEEAQTLHDCGIEPGDVAAVMAGRSMARPVRARQGRALQGEAGRSERLHSMTNHHAVGPVPDGGAAPAIKTEGAIP
jgi:hypothetical protein